MNASELKLQIFKQIELLDKNQLSELSGILSNMVHGQYGIDDWENLSKIEKEGIFNSIQEMDAGNGIPHNLVMDKVRKKVLHV